MTPAAGRVRRSRLRGGSAHRIYSVAVFVVLAALDNVALALPPPLTRDRKSVV